MECPASHTRHHRVVCDKDGAISSFLPSPLHSHFSCAAKRKIFIQGLFTEVLPTIFLPPLSSFTWYKGNSSRISPELIFSSIYTGKASAHWQKSQRYTHAKRNARAATSTLNSIRLSGCDASQFVHPKNSLNRIVYQYVLRCPYTVWKITLSSINRAIAVLLLLRQ